MTSRDNRIHLEAPIEENLVLTAAELQPLVPAGMVVTLVPLWSYLGAPFLRGPLADHLSSDGAYVNGNRGHRDMWAPFNSVVPDEPELVVRCSAFKQTDPPRWLHVHRGDEGAIDAICEPCFHTGHLSRAVHTSEPWGNRFGCSCCGRSNYYSIGD